MFSKLVIFAAATLAVVVSAAPSGIENSCNVTNQHCCNQTFEEHTETAQTLLSIIGLAGGPVTGLVGVNCSPLSVIGGGGNSCSAQPVCCSGNNFNGLVAVGCTPINANL